MIASKNTEKLFAVKAVCKGSNGCGCGWTSEEYPFGLNGEETEDQARLSAVLETRLGHIIETVECQNGKIVTHCVEYRIVERSLITT